MKISLPFTPILRMESNPFLSQVEGILNELCGCGSLVDLAGLAIHAPLFVWHLQVRPCSFSWSPKRSETVLLR